MSEREILADLVERVRPDVPLWQVESAATLASMVIELEDHARELYRAECRGEDCEAAFVKHEHAIVRVVRLLTQYMEAIHSHRVRNSLAYQICYQALCYVPPWGFV